MNIHSILNDYTEIKECSYKGEHYSVRDNGAVLRHAREGKRIRKDDNTWTFGKPNENTGYMEIGTERVHRIVAFAFLGEPPTPQHIVDHIDTNRRNNRPQNLRWLTKLENALNNPITRKKIEYLCGSIEAFVNDPSIIQEFVDDNPNYEWMRTVTPEEAKASYERLCAWAETKNNEKSLGGAIGEWIYTPYGREEKKSPFEREQHNINVTSEQIGNMISIDSHTDSLTESLTPNAMQRYWRTPTEFPLCPSEVAAFSRRWLWQSRSWRTRSRAPTPSTAPTRRSSRHIKTPATASWCCPAICRGKTACTRPTPCLWCTPASAAGGAPSA